MATMKKHVYLLTRYEVDFDFDEKTHRRVGVYETQDDANKAKTMDALKCIKDEGVQLSKASKQEVIKAVKGKTRGFMTIDGFFVREDEVYDNDDRHITSKYSWEIEKVPMK